MNVSTLRDYKEFIAKMSALSELDFSPDPEGLVSLRVDDAYTLNLQYVEASSRILCFVDVVTLPKTCGKEVYRQLLIGGLFGKDTSGGYFALEGESEAVVYNYLFDFDPATSDPKEMLSDLEKLLTLVDVWAEKIAKLVGAPDAEGSPRKVIGISEGSGFMRV